MKRLHSLAEQDILWGRLFTEPWNCQFGFKSGDKTWPSKEAMEPWGHSTLNHGDDNGDWEWTCLSSDHGYLSSDGYYFVKAISRSQIANGSMTGTAKSLEVYPDGTIIDN